ncbi:MAG: hypothetical protein WCK33_04425 [Phycisphaerae bacterium]|jgi:hypothetical protein
MAPTQEQTTCGRHAACLGLKALVLLAATGVLAGGCSVSNGPRERYLAARSIVVEPRASDGALTYSAWPVPLQPTVASATPTQ